MIHAGIGIPHEYFNRMNAGIMGTRYGLGTVTSDDLETDGAKRRAYIAALLEHRTVNGVFAAKIQRGQFRQFFSNYKAIDLFKGAHFIYLYREDLVAQAVSLHMSLLTGRWGIDDVVTTHPAINPNFFDNSLITEIMDDLATQDREWRLFFAKNGIQPLFFSYEGIKDDLSGALRRIVTSFGLDVPSENSNYTEPPITEYRGPGEPSKLEVRNRFAQWLQEYSEAEGFIKLLRAAREKEALERPPDVVIAAHIDATAACPTS
jgi:LPS sulfotransferase NodH